MNPFAIELLTAAVRAAILYLAGAVGQQVSDDVVTKWSVSISLAVVGLALSAWQKYRSRKKLVTALTMAPAALWYSAE